MEVRNIWMLKTVLVLKSYRMTGGSVSPNNYHQP